ncbi:MAG: glycosyltransferase family 4 protein [Ilumatobacter sp.]|uniref:glycosyltransferase family 4 protein n=1 Tax=Ilumatobacter sp. TaxID=1967498 RepID=UPI003C73B820
MTRIVDELVGLGHRVHVVTALPWYRTHAIEDGWTGSWVRRETTPWGSITRVHPFPGDDKTNLVRRAVGFLGYSALAGVQGLRIGGWFRRADAVIAMSPPLTLGLTGRIVATMRRSPLVFNIQDVFPDAAIETGAITNRSVIAVARLLERVSYRCSDAVTVLSSDLGDNVRAKLPERFAPRVHEIPNFVDTAAIMPLDRLTSYRSELELGSGPVVLYGGNVGFSQSLELVLGAAQALPDVQFLINGDGAARSSLEAAAAHLPNVTFRGYIAAELLAELLATGDIHVVPLKAGLGRVSVPSKTYSIMAAGRPVLAAVDPDTAVPRILEESGGGVAVVPDDLDAFIGALTELLADPEAAEAMGRRGREWAVANASPAAVGSAYSDLLGRLSSQRALHSKSGG